MVTGLGLVTPLGINVDKSWQNLLNGDTAVRALEANNIPEVSATHLSNHASWALNSRGSPSCPNVFLMLPWKSFNYLPSVQSSCHFIVAANVSASATPLKRPD